MHPPPRPSLGLALGLGILFCPVPALAQANYEGALIGGRSSLMGGTGVAFGTDAASPLQNPATTVGVLGTSFVFSTFFVQLSARSLNVAPSAAEEVERGSPALSETQFRVLPTATCLFLDLVKRPGDEPGSHKLSICIAEPEHESYWLNTRVLATTTTNQVGFQNRFLNQNFSKKVYAAGWAMTLGHGLSIGLTPMVEDVSHQDAEGIVDLLADTPDPASVIGAEAEQMTNVKTRRASAIGASALLGVRYQVNPKFGAGLSLQTPTLHLFGSYQSTRSSDQLFGDTEQYLQESGSARFTYPLRLALGIGGALGPVRYEINGYLHGKQGDFVEVSTTRQTVTIDGGEVSDTETESVIYQEAARPVANLGVGVEVPFRRQWSLLFGFLTDISGLSPRQTGTRTDDVLFRNRTDLLHGSVGVAWNPPAGSLLLGTRFFYGQGELAITDARTIPPLLVAQPENRWGLSLVLSGQLTLEMLQLADPTGLVKKATKGESTPKAPD